MRLCADLEDSLAGADIAGVLEFGAIPTVLTGTLPGALASMRAAQPRLLVRLTSGLSGELARRVYKGELDAGIVTEPVELATGLSWHPIAAEPLVVIALTRAVFTRRAPPSICCVCRTITRPSRRRCRARFMPSWMTLEHRRRTRRSYNR